MYFNVQQTADKNPKAEECFVSIGLQLREIAPQARLLEGHYENRQ